MTAAAAEENHGGPEGPETTDSPEEPEVTEPEANETSEENEVEEPDIYDFSEGSGYTVNDLNQEAYEELSDDSYLIDEDNENVLIADSSWESVEEALSGDEEESQGLWSKTKDYLFNHDKKYAAGGAAGVGIGEFTGLLGYTTAAGVLTASGGAALGWGIGGLIGDKIAKYLSDSDSGDEESEELEHELTEYSDWDIEVVNNHDYGRAMEEYAQQQE